MDAKSHHTLRSHEAHDHHGDVMHGGSEAKIMDQEFHQDYFGELDNDCYDSKHIFQALAVTTIFSVAVYMALRSSSFSAEKILSLILGIYRRIKLLLRKIRGDKEDDISNERIVSGQAWDEFCDSIKAAGASLIYGKAPLDPYNQAEGLRYLTRLLRGGLEQYMECHDPAGIPKVTALADIFRDCPVSIGAPNPDNLYQSATLDSKYEYKVIGNRNTVHYLNIATQSGSYGGPGGLKTVVSRDIHDVDVSKDGSFQLYLSAKKPDNIKENNWLALDSSVSDASIIVRQTFVSRKNETPASLHIERVGGDGRPSKFKPKDIDEALQKIGLMVAGASLRFSLWANEFKGHPNQLPLFNQERSNNVGGDPDIRYYHSYWKVAEDEALVIKATPPNCAFWNFQLDNYWMEALDARYYKIWVNNGSAKYRKDNSVQVVIAHKNPAEIIGKDIPYNWIETCDHTEGTMLWRWVKPVLKEGEQLPNPETLLVKFSDLPNVLGN